MSFDNDNRIHTLTVASMEELVKAYLFSLVIYFSIIRTYLSIAVGFTLHFSGFHVSNDFSGLLVKKQRGCDVFPHLSGEKSRK